MSEAGKLELQEIDLQQYKERVRHLRRPSLLQAHAFADFVSGAHSWYKTLAVISIGSGFSFYLSPDAGVHIWWDEKEGLKRKPCLPDDTPLHYSWKTTEKTISEFAYLDYCRYRDSSTEENLPIGSSVWFSDQGKCLAVPHAVLQKAFVPCTALLHTHSHKLSSVIRLSNFRALQTPELEPKDFSPQEWRVIEIVRTSIEDKYAISDLQEEFANLAALIRDQQLAAIVKAIERLGDWLEQD